MRDFNYFTFPIIVAITGASGTIYGFRFLQFLLENNYSVELVISESGCKVAKDEINLDLSQNAELMKEQVLIYLESIKKLLGPTSDSPSQTPNLDERLNTWNYKDISASISSGSYRTQGMVIIPASMGTIGAIANGTSDNLITRAADVCLKENRKLVIVPREMPFSTIHLENLLKLSKNNVTIAPASPAFYNKPNELIDAIDFVVGKVLDLFGIDHHIFKRWKKVYPKIQV